MLRIRHVRRRTAVRIVRRHATVHFVGSRETVVRWEGREVLLLLRW